MERLKKICNCDVDWISFANAFILKETLVEVEEIRQQLSHSRFIVEKIRDNTAIVSYPKEEFTDAELEQAMARLKKICNCDVDWLSHASIFLLKETLVGVEEISQQLNDPRLTVEKI